MTNISINVLTEDVCTGNLEGVKGKEWSINQINFQVTLIQKIFT